MNIIESVNLLDEETVGYESPIKCPHCGKRGLDWNVNENIFECLLCDSIFDDEDLTEEIDEAVFLIKEKIVKIVNELKKEEINEIIKEYKRIDEIAPALAAGAAVLKNPAVMKSIAQGFMKVMSNPQVQQLLLTSVVPLITNALGGQKTAGQPVQPAQQPAQQVAQPVSASYIEKDNKKYNINEVFGLMGIFKTPAFLKQLTGSFSKMLENPKVQETLINSLMPIVTQALSGQMGGTPPPGGGGTTGTGAVSQAAGEVIGGM